MAPIQQATCRNRLLTGMLAADFDLLSLERVALPVRKTLVSPQTPITSLVFVERGLASLVTTSHMGQVEVGMIGREGLVGAAPVVLGIDTSPFTCFMQIEGDGFRVAAPDLLVAVGRSASLRELLLSYAQSVLVQTAYTAFSNASFTIEVRLARWLLMCHDRVEGDEIGITHEFLSTMLGVRRPGVTVAIQILEGQHLIRATRGRVTMLDRPGLMALADGSYGLAEVEYERIVGHGRPAAAAA